MKEITNRQEFGKAVNFGEHSVLTIDMNQKGFMDTIYHGDKVRVDFGHFRSGERNLQGGELLYNVKENKFEIASYGICLSNSFSYEDAMEQAEYAKASIINEGDEVVIVMHNSETREVRAFMVTAKNKREFCSTMIEFE